MLSDLPLELQAYILTFLPSRTLARTLNSANRHFNTLVDAHLRRSIQRLLAVGAYAHTAASSEGIVLEFEAQRPIDTVTAKHTLHFSGFQDGPDARTTIAHPTEAADQAATPKVAASRAIFSFSESVQSELAGRAALSPEQRYDEQRRFSGNAFQPFMPVIHRDDVHRLNPGIATSSVNARHRLQSRPAADDEGQGVQHPATEGHRPAPSPHVHPAPSAPEARSAGRGFSTTPVTTSAPRDTSTLQSLEMPLDAYDWQGPSGASPRTSLAAANLHPSLGNKPACYAFQLDPLDSFESLILTLSARKCIPDLAAAYTGRTSGRRPSSPSSGPNPAGPRGDPSVASSAQLHDADEAFASMSALMSTFGPINRFRPQTSAILAPPPQRQLEFDSTSCTLTIQPHAASSSPHPAHSRSSDAYLSSPLTSHYATLNHHDRVELTFHCEYVAINAARLLSSLEMLEEAVIEAEERARSAAMRFPTLLAGSASSDPMVWGRNGVWSLAADGLRPVNFIDAESAVGRHPGPPDRSPR
ncbi:uncharacterized protein PSFLO_02708 [Pseudozyma flocculosa]|uniref:F-box domain-containing protein n=1 Tax=Pseudozyma flocculosa TaxID=84751 RepID=A0A5C3F029_9BASI|nr:uncharacterized protein PSFLO_02708 [Pseudozyma flocculosa]